MDSSIFVFVFDEYMISYPYDIFAVRCGLHPPVEYGKVSRKVSAFRSFCD